LRTGALFLLTAGCETGELVSDFCLSSLDVDLFLTSSDPNFVGFGSGGLASGDVPACGLLSDAAALVLDFGTLT